MTNRPLVWSSVIIILLSFGVVFLLYSRRPETGGAPTSNEQNNPYNYFPIVGEENGSPISGVIEKIVDFGKTLVGGEDTKEEARLTKIYAQPAVALGKISVGQEEQLLFVDQKTGQPYRVLSETTIEKIGIPFGTEIYSGFWLKQKTNLFLFAQKLSDGRVSNQLLAVSTSSATVDNEKEVASGSDTIVSSPSQESFFYLSRTSAGSEGQLASLIDTKSKKIFSHNFSQWLPQWTAGGIYLITKPSANYRGFLYKLDQTTGKLGLVVGDKGGLMVKIGNSDSYALLSESSQDWVETSILDIKNKKVVSATVNTLAEKCVSDKTGNLFYCAAPNTVKPGTYPDNWYQGEMSFDDNFWIIEAKSGLGKILYDKKKFGPSEQLDAINLVISGDNLYFTNKVDGSVWRLSLSEEAPAP